METNKKSFVNFKNLLIFYIAYEFGPFSHRDKARMTLVVGDLSTFFLACKVLSRRGFELMSS
jgi:hypothetical protein